MRVVFVHGACVRDGSWWWHRTAELLAERGVASVAPALPSCGETGEPVGADGPGLAEDVAAVRRVLTAGDEPTVVVAHSYGGIVTAEAAAGVDAGAPPAARLELPARGRAEPLLVRRRGARPVPRRRSRGRHVHRPAGGAGRDVPAGLRSGDPARGRGPDGPAEPGGPRAAGAGGGLAARALDVPGLRAGPGHPGRAAARVRRAGRAASSSSTPATTRSCPGPPPSAT